jgi:hypothetical protein
VGPGRDQFVEFTDTSPPDAAGEEDHDQGWDEEEDWGGVVGPGVLVI